MSANQFAVKQVVYWHDPDNGFSSGFYTITEIMSETGCVESSDTLIMIVNEAGSQAEVFPHEISPVLPLSALDLADIDFLSKGEGWLLSLKEGGSTTSMFVIERDPAGSLDEEDALEFVRGEAGQGSRLHRLALEAHGKTEKEVLGIAEITLTLNVKYQLNGTSIEDRRAYVEQNIQEMISAGGLSGESEAEVYTYDYSTVTH